MRPNSKDAFLASLPGQASILDVGCGNNSPHKVKTLLPNSHYTGIDVGDYNQTKPNLADAYIITEPEKFAEEIEKLKNSFDAVISTHNIEHCFDRSRTLKAMVEALKPGGKILLVFPSAMSVHFPQRDGTLNYHDDPTHKDLPPDFHQILSELKKMGVQITYSTERYQPIVLRTIGFLFEPLSRLKKKIMPGTWEYYGFESVIVGKKYS